MALRKIGQVTNTVYKWRYLATLGLFILFGFGFYATETIFRFQMLEQKYLDVIKPAFWTRVASLVLAAAFLWIALLRNKKVNKVIIVSVTVAFILTASLSFRSLAVNKTIGKMSEHWTIFKVRTILLKGLNDKDYCYGLSPFMFNLSPLKSDEKIRIFRGVWPLHYDRGDFEAAMAPWTPCATKDSTKPYNASMDSNDSE
jgi:hypothetical protein